MIDGYDDRCADFFVAVRAVWLLWRRGAWKQLAELGLTRDMIDEQFRRFDLLVVEESQKRLRSDSQTELLLHSLSEETRKAVRAAALTLNLTYVALHERMEKPPEIKKRRRRAS